MAVTTIYPSRVWQAIEGVIKVALASDVSITTAAALNTFFSTSNEFEAVCKNISITPPEGTLDKVDLMGLDAKGFQAQFLEEKPFGMATISGTMVLDADETVDDFMAGKGMTAMTETAYTRRQYGVRVETASDGSAPTHRPEIAILVDLTSGSDTVSFVLDNAYMTKLGDKRIAGPDGHWEVDFNATCLAKDYYEEYKD